MYDADRFESGNNRLLRAQPGFVLNFAGVITIAIEATPPCPLRRCSMRHANAASSAPSAEAAPGEADEETAHGVTATRTSVAAGVNRAQDQDPILEAAQYPVTETGAGYLAFSDDPNRQERFTSPFLREAGEGSVFRHAHRSPDSGQP
jgi:hypothetical protein